MRIEEVTLYSFGPFVNRRIQLGPGMTLIAGKNEAGKSTVHAALYAALCGIRRGRGQPQKEDREFSERHKPWTASKAWDVGAFVTLDDGRRMELRQSLDGSAPSYAKQLSGEDISASILNGGSPDASLLMGLDRRSFAATACVRQAEVLEVIEDAAALQSHLQRAAAGVQRDETAALALARIADFEREQVGQDRANSTKPLRRARQELAATQAACELAAQERRDVAAKVAAAAAAEKVAASLASEINAISAAVARLDSNEAARRLARVHKLSARFPEGAPSSSAADDELAVQVLHALEAWRTSPDVPALVGPSADDLRQQLMRLPDKPAGDTAPHASVLQARGEYQRAVLATELHHEQRPELPRPMAPSGLDEDEVRNLAGALDQIPLRPLTQVPSVVGAVPNALGVAGWLALATAVLLVVVGVQAVVSGLTFGYVGVLIAIAIAARVLWSQSRDRSRRKSANQAGGLKTADVPDQLARTRKRLRELQVPEDSTELRQLADAMSANRRAGADFEQWNRRHQEIAAGLSKREAALAERLRERGADVADDVEASVLAYVTACTARSETEHHANLRPALEERVAYRQAAEGAAALALHSRETAARFIHDAALACGVDAADPDARYRGLETWLDRRRARLETISEQQREWAELQALVDGHDLVDLAAEADALETQALVLERESGGSAPRTIPPDSPDHLRALRARYEEANRTAAALRAESDVASRQAPSEAVLNERLGRAKEDLRRIEDLARVLALTREFLQHAQDRVHLTLAPVLQNTLDTWLPRITGGRYVKSLVDPQTLTVRVRAPDGPLRDAQLLSHGTSEQIYLLLRLAITEHLTRGRESSPLILDDVIVQSDVDRASALLGLLHELSSTRQVILSTVSREAEAWARQNFVDSRDRLEILDAAVPA